MNDENEKKSGFAPDEDDMPDTDDTDLEEFEDSEDSEPEDTNSSFAPIAASKPNEKTGEKKNRKAKPEKKNESLLAEIKGEFKKIVWPPRRELVKQTTTVIIVALMFGVIIFLMDTVFGFGINNFIDLMIG